MSGRSMGLSPLSGKVFLGRINQSGSAYSGAKTDVTSDFLRLVIEKAEFHGGTFEIEGGDKKWTVTVSEQPAGEGEK